MHLVPIFYHHAACLWCLLRVGRLHAYGAYCVSAGCMYNNDMIWIPRLRESSLILYIGTLLYIWLSLQ